MPKKILILLILIISFGLLVFNFLKTQEAKAGTDDNVRGWAWSNMERPVGDPEGDHDPTIGWISFNCRNYYNGVLDSHCIADGYASDYGVNIDADGKFSGHAWSGGGEGTCGGDVTFTYKGEQVTYGTVESNGKCWMDRNLGASRVALTYDDSVAYGDLFQWGRCDDGHQDRGSATYLGPVGTDACDAGNDWDDDFITKPLDGEDVWLSPGNNNLWQGVSGINNPCPSGWRIPTKEEFEVERVSWSSPSYNGAFDSSLKLTAGGDRECLAAGIHGTGIRGNYWSSDISNPGDDEWAWRMFFDDDSNSMIIGTRGTGSSVRCVQDNDLPVLGWLSFNRAETGPPPGAPDFGTHLAQVSTTTGQVSGWARFLAACDSVPCTSSGPCANCGGWDGWIKLGNLPHQPWHAGVGQQVYIDFGAGPPSDFHGWAWGDDVVGWISFNCQDTGACGDSDYKVMTDFSFTPVGTPPTAAMSCDDVECQGPGCVCSDVLPWEAFVGVDYRINNDSYAGDNPISTSTWSVISKIGYDKVCPGPIDGDPLCNYERVNISLPPLIDFEDNVIELEVVDSILLDDTASNAIRVKRDTSADFECSLVSDAGPWENCDPPAFKAEQNQVIYFRGQDGTNLSRPSYYTGIPGPAIDNWQWEKGVMVGGTFVPAGLPFGNSSIASTTFTIATSTIRLTVTDNHPADPLPPYNSIGRSAEEVKTINVKLPLPEYREVRPRSQLDNFLARIAGIFR